MAAPPYAPGDHVALLSPDPEGMRVNRAEVLDVEVDGDGWQVETTLGTERVDGTGEGAALVPIDLCERRDPWS